MRLAGKLAVLMKNPINQPVGSLDIIGGDVEPDPVQVNPRVVGNPQEDHASMHPTAQPVASARLDFPPEGIKRNQVVFRAIAPFQGVDTLLNFTFQLVALPVPHFIRVMEPAI